MKIRNAMLVMVLAGCDVSTQDPVERSAEDISAPVACAQATIHYVISCEYEGVGFGDYEYAACPYSVRVVSDAEFEVGETVTVAYVTCDDGRAVQMAIAPKTNYHGTDFF